MTSELKKCTNCTRAPQPLDQFIGARGNPVSTCLKCREKNKARDALPERQAYHAELQKERGPEYTKRSRERKKAGAPPPQHNLEQTCAWNQTEQTRERVALWKRLNIHDRISSSKRNAIAKGLDWNLTDEEAKTMITSPCVYCGHLNLDVRLNGIDRLDQKGNYTTENTVACCWTCNFMKGCLDPRTFIEHSAKIASCTREFPDVPRQTNIRPRKEKPPPAPQQENQTTQDPCQDLQGTREGHQCAEKTPSLQTSP